MSSDEGSSIKPTPDGPYLVKNLQRLSNRKGSIEVRATMALCRCGQSANKPFCDGTHAKIGFSSAKLEGRVPDEREEYAAEKITIHDNRGTCAHAGHCTDGLPSVFRLKPEPWIDLQGGPRRRSSRRSGSARRERSATRPTAWSTATGRPLPRSSSPRTAPMWSRVDRSF